MSPKNLALIGLLSFTASAPAFGESPPHIQRPVQRSIKQILKDSYMNNTPRVIKHATGNYVGGVRELATLLAEKGIKDRQEVLRYMRDHMARNPKSPFSAEALATVKETTKDVKSLSKFKQFTQKAGKVLKFIDIVSTAAKAAGYLIEGDTTGASHVVIKDLTKKAAEAAGAFGGSFVAPGGQIIGVIAGEEFYKKYLQPELNAGEKNARLKEYQKKYLNKPWLPVVQVMARDPQTGVARVMTLDPDTFYDQQTGLIVRRTAADQAAFERTARTIWKNSKKLKEFWKAYENGEISQEDLDLLRANLRALEPGTLWEPDLDELRQATEEDMPPGLEGVVPTRVTAAFAEPPDPGWATTTTTFSFWNVGGLMPGKEAVTVTVVAKFEGLTQKKSFTGTFSGGPNGKFTVNFGNGGNVVFEFKPSKDHTQSVEIDFGSASSPQFTMRNGQTIHHRDPEGEVLTVPNPTAFANWPK
jgi:hypothetical protein